jgi:hypothetical protein
VQRLVSVVVRKVKHRSGAIKQIVITLVHSSTLQILQPSDIGNQNCSKDTSTLFAAWPATTFEFVKIARSLAIHLSVQSGGAYTGYSVKPGSIHLVLRSWKHI